MRAARRQGLLEVACCGTSPSSRVRARGPPVQHLLRVGYKSGLHAFQGGQRRIMDALVHLRKKMGTGGRGEATAEESVLATPIWGMFCADDAGVVSQSPEQLRKMMGMVVVVCAAFGLTVSEAKTEIMCLRAKGNAGVHGHIQRRSSGPGVQPDERVCIPGGKSQPQCRPVHRGRPAHTQRMVQLSEVHPRTVRPTERSPRAPNPDAKSRGTRDNAVRLRHVEPTRVLLRHAAPSPPQILDSLHRLAKAQSRRPPDFLSGHVYRDGKGEHRGDFTQKADLVCGICGPHGGAWMIRDCRSE